MDQQRKTLDANANEHSLSRTGKLARSSSLISSRRSQNAGRGLGGFARSLLRGDPDVSTESNKSCLSPEILRRLLPTSDPAPAPENPKMMNPAPAAEIKSESDWCISRKENIPLATPAERNQSLYDSGVHTSMPLDGRRPSEDDSCDLFEDTSAVTAYQAYPFLAIDSKKLGEKQEIKETKPVELPSVPRKAFSEEKQTSKCDNSGSFQSSRSEGMIHIRQQNLQSTQLKSSRPFKVAAVVPGNRTPNPGVFAVPVRSQQHEINTPRMPVAAMKSINTVQEHVQSIGKKCASVDQKKKQRRPSRHEFEGESVKGKSYARLSLLGQGAFGKVYRVQEAESDKLYAMKIIQLKQVDTACLQECRNEINLLASLRDSKFVVQIYEWDHDERNSLMRILMEHGECDLAQIFKDPSFKTESSRYIQYLWHGMLEVVAFIHERGVVHADLKPSNFVLVRGRIKIIDFGISSRLQQDHTSVSLMNPKGTLNYISPESICPNQETGKVKVGPKSDIWALGCILHLMIYGKTPFSDLPYYARMSAIASCNINYVELPTKFKGTRALEVIKMCLQPNPRDRPSASDLFAIDFCASK